MHLSLICSRQQSTFEVIQRKAIAEKRQKNAEAGNEETHLSVSGDGSWKRRGFSSLFGIATLIGKYTHKVLDFVVKSSFCQSSNWASKKGTNEYDIWHDTHEQHCSINHTGSAGKMEVDCMKEMFCRSESHGVKYATYIGDGDTKTFQALLNCNPYSDLTVHKKECIGHVQKRKNDNESFNACLWKLVPKHLHCGEQTIRTAAYIASGIFNEGYSSILKTMQTLGIVIGTNSRNFAAKTDEERVKSANAKQSELMKKARIEKMSAQVQQNMLFEDEEGTLYGAGIAD